MNTIIRKKKTNSSYVVIDKGFLDNTDLSWKSKGLLAYLLCKPDDWQIYIEALKGISKDGRDGTRTALNELIALGYITRNQRRSKGLYKGVEYIVHETPYLEVDTKTPNTEKPFTENPTLLNNNYTKIYRDLVQFFIDTTGRTMRVQKSDARVRASDKYKLVKARLDEGYTVNDLKSIIEHQNKLWGKDKRMSQYIRFQTLFAKRNTEKYIDDIANATKFNVELITVGKDYYLENKDWLHEVEDSIADISVTIPLLLEIGCSVLGKCFNGSTPERRINSFRHWYLGLSEWDRSHKDIRYLIKLHMKKSKL